MKRVYARFVGRAHPSIRGYAVEHALRKLADDQRNPSNIAGLALHALHHGPDNLPVLADELEETNHPMKDAYNWRAIPRGIAIDQAALAADRELGSPYPNLEYQPGNNISLAWLVDDGNQGIGEAARVRGHNALRRIRGRIADSVPDATPEEVSESIRRLALTRQDLTNSEAYPMLARQHHAKHNAIYPAAPGVSRHDDARRFRGTQVLLRRRPLKVRYAQFVGRAHPSIRGYHVEHALRSLADPDRNHPDIAGLARHALENGPGNLPILADALEEHEHPALGDYNWKAIPRGIQVDQAVRGAARSIAARIRDGRTSAASVMRSASLQLPELSRPAEWHSWLGPSETGVGLNDLHATARGVVPDLSARELFDSLRRLRDVRSRTAPGLGWSIAGTLHVNRDAAGNATGPVSPGSGPVGEAHRFGSSPVSLGNTRLGPPLARRPQQRRMSRKVRYASFPGADQPTVTVRVPVPTPAPMTKKKPPQPVLQKFGNTVAPAPPPQPAVPGVIPQQPQDQDFSAVPFAGPRTIIFPQSPPPKGRPVQPRRMNRPVRYAADPHGTEFWNPPPHHQADPMVVARRDRDPLWNYHRGITGYGGGVPMYGEKPAGWHVIDMTQTGGWNEDATHPPPEGLVTHRHARERWGGVYAAPGSEPSPDQLLRASGDAGPGPRQAFAPIDDWVRLPGDFNQQHPANRDRYNALFDFHGTGRRPWYQAVFPLQELSMHSEQNDPYGLLSSAVITGNRHAVGPLVDLLKKRDNPAGWWKGWATLHKAMTDRIGDLPPQEVIRRVGAIADATGGHSESPNEHARIANSAKSAAESGDFLGYVALADHMEENGLPQYAQLVRAELANVIHGLRGEPKGRRRFSRPTPQRV